MATSCDVLSSSQDSPMRLQQNAGIDVLLGTVLEISPSKIGLAAVRNRKDLVRSPPSWYGEDPLTGTSESSSFGISSNTRTRYPQG